jgi:beta-1,4-mannosyltransferase
VRVLMMPDYRAGNPYQQLLAKSLEAAGVEVVFPLGYRRGLPITRAMRDAKADVLHLHWLEPYSRPWLSFPHFVIRALKLVLDLLLVRARGARIVWTVHNEVSHESKNPRTERAVSRIVAALADRIIVHEEVRLGTYPRAVVIRHGPLDSIYEAPVVAEEARRALELRVDGRIFLHLSMLRPYKGLEALLEAWGASGLAPRNLLVIAGAPQDRAYGERLTELARGLDGVRLLLEFIPADRVHLYFSAADLVVLPFTRVATSSSVILALAFGRPLVVPRLPTIVETLGDPAPAVFYEPTAEAGLRGALEAAVTVDLAPLARLATERARRFDWASIGLATRAAYLGEDVNIDRGA